MVNKLVITHQDLKVVKILGYIHENDEKYVVVQNIDNEIEVLSDLIPYTPLECMSIDYDVMETQFELNTTDDVEPLLKKIGIDYTTLIR